MYNPYLTEESFLVATKCCLKKDDKILIVWENRHGKPLWWELPGGKISKADQDLSPIESLARELWEELREWFWDSRRRWRTFYGIQILWRYDFSDSKVPFIFLCYVYEVPRTYHNTQPWAHRISVDFSRWDRENRRVAKWFWYHSEKCFSQKFRENRKIILSLPKEGIFYIIMTYGYSHLSHPTCSGILKYFRKDLIFMSRRCTYGYWESTSGNALKISQKITWRNATSYSSFSGSPNIWDSNSFWNYQCWITILYIHQHLMK